MHFDNKFTVISLFSGGMGLDLGLKASNRFKILACIEKEKSFCETIRKNKQAGRLENDILIIESDINEIDPQDLLSKLNMKPGDLDLLAGGPPCQSFSTAGKRQTVQDPRGTLLWRFLYFIEILKPKFFLMENVRGLLSAALKHRPIKDRPEHGGAELQIDEMPGSVVRLFSEDLQRISPQYHMDCFEVNSVNYGAPQIRERAIFIGNKYNAEVEFPRPTHGSPDHCNPYVLKLPGLSDRSLNPWRTLRDAIADIKEDNPIVLDFSPRKKSYLAKVPPGSNWRSLPMDDQMESMGKAFYAKGGRSGWWRRLTLDLPCPTLVTMPNHASTSLCHPTETRALSLREYARIQEFPDDWEFAGKITEQYAQVGNAVPTRLGKVAGELIASELDTLSNRDWAPYDVQREGYRIVYVQSHVRTRKWFKDGKTIVWSDGGDNGCVKYDAPKTHRKIKTI